MKVNVL
jgi:hypothetical protein